MCTALKMFRKWSPLSINSMNNAWQNVYTCFGFGVYFLLLLLLECHNRTIGTQTCKKKAMCQYPHKWSVHKTLNEYFFVTSIARDIRRGLR